MMKFRHIIIAALLALLVTTQAYSQKITVPEFRHHSLLTSYVESATLAVAADVVVIPLTVPYIIKTTGGDAEALTLANGLPGQMCVINLTTDGGGDGTLTPATGTGWATIVLADAGDQCILLYIDDTVGWIILGISGKTQPPVMT